MTNTITLILLMSCLSIPVHASETDDPAPVDTLRLLSDTPLKSPMGAVLRSAVLPGWGQAYNEAYPKALLAASLNGAMIWRSLYFNNKQNDSSLPNDVRSNAKDRRNASNWLVGLTYFITLVDAYVDAWLFEFDTAISIGSLEAADDPRALGIQLRIKL